MTGKKEVSIRNLAYWHHVLRLGLLFVISRNLVRSVSGLRTPLSIGPGLKLPAQPHKMRPNRFHIHRMDKLPALIFSEQHAP